jgi:hypothetical protein
MIGSLHDGRRYRVAVVDQLFNARHPRKILGALARRM